MATPATRSVVARFVAGETIDEALAVTASLTAASRLVTIDFLGEDTADPGQATAVTDEYVRLLARLCEAGLAAGGRAEVSVKPTAVGLGLPVVGEKTALENIRRVAAAARNAGTTVTIDMEDHTRVDATLRLVRELRADFPDLGCVIQSYLQRSADDLDASYARCLRILLDGPGYPMLATHDPRLIRIATARAGLAGRDNGSFEYQMLYGIRPAEQARLAASGAQVRVYVPYGSDWYGYLVRRLAERPANLMFFLRALVSRR